MGYDTSRFLDDQPVGFAAFTQAHQLVDRPVARIAAEIDRRMELDARETELSSEGRDRLVEPLEVTESEPDGHRRQAAVARAVIVRPRRSPPAPASA